MNSIAIFRLAFTELKYSNHPDITPVWQGESHMEMHFHSKAIVDTIPITESPSGLKELQDFFDGADDESNVPRRENPGFA